MITKQFKEELKAKLREHFLRRVSKALRVIVDRVLWYERPRSASCTIVLPSNKKIHFQSVGALLDQDKVRAKIRAACKKTIPRFSKRKWWELLGEMSEAAEDVLMEEKRPAKSRCCESNTLSKRLQLPWPIARRLLEARLGHHTHSRLASALGVRVSDIKAWDTWAATPEGPAVRLIQVLLYGPHIFGTWQGWEPIVKSGE